MKFNNFFIAILIIPAIIGCNAQKNTTDNGSEKAEMKTELDSISYGLGLSVAGNLKSQFDTLNLETFSRGIEEGMGDEETAMSQQEVQQMIRAYMQEKQQNKGKDNLEKGQAFLKKNKEKEGVKVTNSGLQYKVLKEGEGPKPSAEDKVSVHYHGTLINGEVFDSSVDRGKPATFPVNGVIKGWQEALQLMKEGAKWKLWIPSDLAYGPKGSRGKIGPNETLIFEVELLDVKGKGKE